jgi:hypothetical protein
MPTSAMDGNVTRPMIIKDLLSAMKDVNFSQLVEEYGSMAGLPREDTTPMTKSLMEKSPKAPNTPLKQSGEKTETNVAASEQFVADDVEVPTPMSDAMALNTLAPTGSIVEQNNGLMAQSNGLQQTT